MRRHIVALALLLAGLCAAPLRAETICTLLMDAASGAVLLEEGKCDRRVTPASTFKIPLDVMGYEAGALTDAHSPVLDFRKGDPDWGGANWTRPTDPADWMRHSVLWYSQRITRAMGAEALTRHAQAFGYGNADFSGDAGFDNGLERAWVSSSLLVSPREQAEVLRALVQDALPVRGDAMALARSLVEVQQIGPWQLHGKTGSAYPRRTDRSFDYARGWGWYVGWAQSGDQTVVFVRLTQATQRSATSTGLLTRDALLQDWSRLIAP